MRDPGFNADRVPTVASVKRGAQLFALPGAKRRPPKGLAPGASPFKACLGALTDFLLLKLRKRSENREKDVADQFIIRRQVRLAVAVEADAIGGETLRVDYGRSHTNASEPVECPHEHHVELASRSIGEQPAELLSLVGTLAPLSWSTYSRTTTYPMRSHHARSCISWFSGSWPLLSVETIA
jgi:hypothetical protein